jgi:hypothetical protein
MYAFFAPWDRGFPVRLDIIIHSEIRKRFKLNILLTGHKNVAQNFGENVEKK